MTWRGVRPRSHSPAAGLSVCSFVPVIGNVQIEEKKHDSDQDQDADGLPVTSGGAVKKTSRHSKDGKGVALDGLMVSRLVALRVGEPLS